MITAQELQLLRVGITEVFMGQYERPTRYEQFMNVETSNKAYEEFMNIIGFPLLPEWNADGGELPIVTSVYGGRTMFVHRDYGFMWTVSKRLLRDDQYRVVERRLTEDAARAAKTTAEIVAHIPLNLAESTELRLWDNFPLLSQRTLQDGTNYNPRVNSALTWTGFRTALGNFRRMKNYRGQPIWLEPRYLVVSPELEANARLLVESTTIPDSNAPVSNPYLKYNIQVVVDPYLNNSGAWFLLADKGEHRLMFFWREKPKPVTERDFRSQGLSTAITMALSAGAADWIGVVGCVTPPQ